MKLLAILIGATILWSPLVNAQTVTSGLQPATSVSSGDEIIIDQGSCNTCTHKATVQQLLAAPNATAGQAASSAAAALSAANAAVNTANDAAAAVATKATLGTDGTLSAQTVKPTGSSVSASLAAIGALIRPHVANNAALTASALYAYLGATVSRDGLAAPGDGGQAVYTYSSSACSISGGDGGTQIPAAMSGCWIVDPTTPITIELFAGAIGLDPNSGVMPSADASPALQKAVNTGKPVAVRPLAYRVNEQISIITSGQPIGGLSRTLTRFLVDSAWSSPGGSVFKTDIPAGGAEGPTFRNFAILISQPSVTSIGALIQVSCLDLRDTISNKVSDLFLLGCLRSVDLRGNTGQSVIDDLQSNAFVSDIAIDGATDSIRISKFHNFLYQQDANLRNLVLANNEAIQSGRMDDLKISDSMCIAAKTCMHFLVGTAQTHSGAGYTSLGGQTTGSVSNFDFDTVPTGLEMDIGNVSVVGGYCVSTQCAILTFGNLNLNGINITPNQDGSVANNGGILNIQGGQIDGGNRDTTWLVQNGGVTTLAGTIYDWTGPANVTKPRVAVHAGQFVGTGNAAQYFGAGTRAAGVNFWSIDNGVIGAFSSNLTPGWGDQPTSRAIAPANAATVSTPGVVKDVLINPAVALAALTLTVDSDGTTSSGDPPIEIGFTQAIANLALFGPGGILIRNINGITANTRIIVRNVGGNFYAFAT